MSLQAPWRSTLGSDRSRTPFHPVDIPLLSIPGMGQESIMPDSCHCFHLGWGIDLAASGLVLKAKCGCFEGRFLQNQLQTAYKKFTRWCYENKKTSGIGWWSISKLDMKSPLNVTTWHSLSFGEFELFVIKGSSPCMDKVTHARLGSQAKRLAHKLGLVQLESVRHGLGAAVDGRLLERGWALKKLGWAMQAM